MDNSNNCVLVVFDKFNNNHLYLFVNFTAAIITVPGCVVHNRLMFHRPLHTQGYGFANNTLPKTRLFNLFKLLNDWKFGKAIANKTPIRSQSFFVMDTL